MRLRLLGKIKSILFSDRKSDRDEYSIIFPYSNGKELKNQQIWTNLQKGILFEDNQVFIPWATTFNELTEFAEKRVEYSDRTIWQFGDHKLFDGYNCFIEISKWCISKSSAVISEIQVFLGYDEKGNYEFLKLKNKLTDLFGIPNSIQLEKFGDFDIGHLEWTNQAISIRLIGIDQHACKYSLRVGLKSN